MFGALPELAAELRRIAANAFAVPAAEAPPSRQPLINRLGPMRRHDQFEVPRERTEPGPPDWEALIAGRHIEPDRLVPAWRVVDAWLEARDRGTATFNMTSQEVEAFDFSLTKAGLPAQFGLRNLLANDVAIPVRPAHGMHIGYAKNGHVMATREQLHHVLGMVDEGDHGPAKYLASFLDAFAGWTEHSRAADGLLPDLVVIWWQTARGEQPAATSRQAAHDPTAPIVTGRQSRQQPPATGSQERRGPAAFDPTQPIVTGRQTRQ